MVTQETYLFHATVRENLLYAKPDATRGRARGRRARGARSTTASSSSADGYDTLVGERGYRMSGGEKQRLAIARVDPQGPARPDPRRGDFSARHAQRAARAGRARAADGGTDDDRDRAPACRRSSRRTSSSCSSGGRLVERGTHAELVARGGLYAGLYAQQFAGGLVEARCEDGVVLASGDVVEMAAAGS